MALLHLVLAAVLTLAVHADAGEAPGPTITGIGKPASECFVTLRGLTATDGRNRIDCTDGDPSCDVDGDDQGACTFYARACIAQEIAGCQATSITAVKVLPKKLGVPLPPLPASAPVCGEQATIRVPLTKRGTKPGRLRVVLTATNDGKPKKEKDQIRFTCVPPGAPTTTLGSVTTTTSTLPPPNPLNTTTSTTIIPGTDVLENGDFGLPVLSSPQNGWSFENVPGAGWHSDGGNPGGYFTLNASGEGTTDPTLSQEVEVFPGTLYRLTGLYRSFSPSFGNASKPDAFAVQVVPTPLDFPTALVLALPRPSPNPLAWTPFSTDFTPSGPSSTVSFIAERGGDDSSFDVDELTLSPVQ